MMNWYMSAAILSIDFRIVSKFKNMKEEFLIENIKEFINKLSMFMLKINKGNSENRKTNNNSII